METDYDYFLALALALFMILFIYLLFFDFDCFMVVDGSEVSFFKVVISWDVRVGLS